LYSTQIQASSSLTVSGHVEARVIQTRSN